MNTVPSVQDPQRADAPIDEQPIESSWPARNFDPAAPRQTLIATAAYYRAARRDFEPGHELEDWLAAEREIEGIGNATGDAADAPQAD
ncbi:MAG TPA: DUF2934 domain-containing protein [Steroidobacteraceae bacterium]